MYEITVKIKNKHTADTVVEFLQQHKLHNYCIVYHLEDGPSQTYTYAECTCRTQTPDPDCKKHGKPVEPPRTLAYADYLGKIMEDPGPPPTLEVEPPQGANAEPSEKVTFKLDFTGTWKTRGGYFVKVTGFHVELQEWIGHYMDRQGIILYWDQDGKNASPDLDLMEKFREGAGFANA